ncbi:MAG TPA: hypothetical protein VE934_16155 [Polaromonas sp.]|nr:hypothetical protein [Polaromonas sp.]
MKPSAKAGRFLRHLCLTAGVALALGACTAQQQEPDAAPQTNAQDYPPVITAPDPGVLLMLVPDGQSVSDPRVTAWIDAASEEGVRLRPVTDRNFKSLGTQALGFAGLVLPDGIHRAASDDLIRAIRSYTRDGGQTMLVYDFGVLKRDSFGRLVYPDSHSRLSDIAGVEYALYEELREKTTGLGPIVAKRESLRDLLVPPGKSLPYNGASSSPVAKTDQAQPATTPVPTATATNPTETYWDEDAYSGYIHGNLTYPSFATQGQFPGTLLARSPEFGVAAGVQKYGQGTVLFVNMPVTYLKLRTDGLPMHGFLRYFVEHVVKMARLSPMPDAIPGLVLNWHFDSMAAQVPTLALEKLGVFDGGPFSIDITAGPDTIEFGDRLGWNLDNNPVAQGILQRLHSRGHSIGSHGGWIHDHYGDGADENNKAEFLPFLELNKASVDRVIGQPMRSYSAPQGNNATWAMDWLEAQGVVSAYFTGHTGLGPTRHYRDGKLRNPNMWIFPVTPQGRYAVFDEFEYYKVPKKQIVDWYHNMVDFVIEKNTSRLIYMHPPWAYEWKDVLLDLLAYAKAKGPDHFRWYTPERLADFMSTRIKVSWIEVRTESGATRFRASHPENLKEMVWLIPKSRSPLQPIIESGAGAVVEDRAHWLVKAGSGTSLAFVVQPR